MVTQHLLEVFLPLLGIFVAFFFADGGGVAQVPPGQDVPVSPEAFWFAILVVAIWTWLPAGSLIVHDTFEAAMRFVDRFQAFGSLVATAALTFYFSVSSRARVGQSPAQ